MIELRQLLYGLFLAGAVYGGIRADLQSLNEKTAIALESAKAANVRIDALLMKGG